MEDILQHLKILSGSKENDAELMLRKYHLIIKHHEEYLADQSSDDIERMFNDRTLRVSEVRENIQSTIGAIEGRYFGRKN